MTLNEMTEINDMNQNDVTREIDAVHDGERDLADVCALQDAQLEAAYQRARGFLQTGFHTQAVDILRALVILRPRSARFQRLLGFALHRSHAFADARGAFAAAMTLEPTDLIAPLLEAECAIFAAGTAMGGERLRGLVAMLGEEPRPYVQRARQIVAMMDAAAEKR